MKCKDINYFLEDLALTCGFRTPESASSLLRLEALTAAALTGVCRTGDASVARRPRLLTKLADTSADRFSGTSLSYNLKLNFE